MRLLVILFLSGTVAASGQHGGSADRKYPEQSILPKPYSFNYQITDDYGNTQFRRERGDESGAVMGSYGYKNVNGLYRSVEYVADSAGFKAQIKSNEPGVGLKGPADVQLDSEPAPPGLQDMYNTRAVPEVPVPAVVSYAGKKGR